MLSYSQGGSESAGGDLGEWSVLFFTGFNEFICDTVAAETRHELSAEQLNIPGSTRWHCATGLQSDS